MTLLATAAELEHRRGSASGALAPLADSLAAELDRFLPSPDIHVPRDKAKLTRAGGRCPRIAR